MAKLDPIQLILERNEFYKRLHFLALGVFGLSMFVSVFLLCILYYIYTHPVEALYFATDDESRLIPIVPVNKPNMSNDQVAAWTVTAVQKAFSYDYVNYRLQLQNAQKYFTNYGWNKYMEAIKANNNLLAISQRKMVAVATVAGAPKLVTQGVLSGAFAWKFEMPVLVTYMTPPYDDKSRFSNPLDVTVIVQRQSQLQSYEGLGILQMVANISAAAQSGPQQISDVPNG